MKQIFFIIYLIIFCCLTTSKAQNARIQIPSGKTYNFTAKNFDFNGKSIAIGENAGAALPITSYFEIYVGNEAAEFVGFSQECIAIGSKAFRNGGGYRNTAIGTESLQFNTGLDNIAFGTKTLQNSQSGIANIAIGSYALQNDLISKYNIAIGHLALNDLGMTGLEVNNNVGIGYLSQYKNSTGLRNTSIGGLSLANGTSVSDNVSVGYYALGDCTGNDNVALGSKALKNGTLANKSVAIGYEAGFHDTLASNSVYIGYQAGSGATNHAKSGNVFIGYRAGYNETGSDRLYIDNTNTSNPLIKGNFNTDALEINGTLNIEDKATFEGSVTDFVHGNTGSSSGVVLKNSNSNDYWRMYVSSSNGDLRLFNNAVGGGSTIVGVFDQATGAYTTSSDRRLKTDIRLFGNVLPSLMATSINSYKFKSQRSEKRSIGVMAQDVQKMFPELIHYDAQSDSYTVDYAGFSMVALKAIQEQQKMMEVLISRIEKLENEK